MSSYQKRTPERLVEILRSSDQNPRSWDQEAAEVLERLCAEVADLTGANELLHAIVSNREEEISDLRAQLASAITVLEQAQDCIRGETPEDMTDEEAREDTISKIRAIILTDENST